MSTSNDRVARSKAQLEVAAAAFANDRKAQSVQSFSIEPESERETSGTSLTETLLAARGVDRARIEAQMKDRAATLAAAAERARSAKRPAALEHRWARQRFAGGSSNQVAYLTLQRGIDIPAWVPRTPPAPPIAVSEVLTAPADDGWSSQPGTDTASQPGIAEINLRVQSTGLGGYLGWGSASGTENEANVSWVYWPSYGGKLFVYPKVLASGNYWVGSSDSGFTRTDARLDLSLYCRLYQSYSESKTLNVLSRNISDGYAEGWIYDSFSPYCDTSVEPDEPVVITIGARLYGYGRSDFAHAEADFFTGGDRFIRVLQVALALFPYN